MILCAERRDMRVDSIELSDFRNYESLKVEFSPDVNILYGDNAAGKTNILEAIYLCSTTKSERAVKERELIRFGCEEAHLRMHISNGDITHKIDMQINGSKSKGVALDSVPLKRAADLYGMVNIISFSPDDLSMIKNGPADRRRFLDMELCQLDKTYMYNLSYYNKVCAQRNNLLKQINDNRELLSTLDIWDSKLVEHGSYIIEKRAEFTKQLCEIAYPIHKAITGDREDINLVYAPNCQKEKLADEIFFSHDRDIATMMTNVGPHRDDIGFEINGQDARKYGSQGQQRTVALCMKLAEIELVKKVTGNSPVLLLDDVLSELDRNRQKELLSYTRGIQTFITCTGLEEFVVQRMGINKVFKVMNSMLIKE